MSESLRGRELIRDQDEEQLFYNLGGKFHKYPDITSVTDIELHPGRNKVLTRITPENIVDLRGIKNPKNVLKRRKRYSMRSRIAQQSIEPDPDLGFDIAKALPFDIRDPYTGKLLNPFEAEVHLVNHGRRSVFIPKDTGLFRGFCGFPHNRVVGEQLTQLVNTTDLIVEGDYGRDWDYIRQPKTGNIIGIRVRIKEDLFWIPPSEDPSPLRVSPNGPGYRDEIRAYLEPAPQDNHPRLLIAETMPMKIPKSVDAIIATNVHTEALEPSWTIAELGSKKEAIHINSHLIDGGSEWIEHGERRGIVLEIRGKGHPLAAPKAVDFYFVEAAA